MKPLTRQQRVALHRVYKRDTSVAGSYTEFRRRVQPAFDNSLMVPWCGMWLGIEPDGYTHS